MRFVVIYALLTLTHTASAACDTEYLWCRLSALSGVTCNTTTGGRICVLPANTSGFSYSKTMAVLIPSNLKTPKQMILGMHGNRGTCPTDGASALDVALSWGATAQLPQDGVMFFPMSSGVTTTYQNELAPRFQDFAAWAEGLTGAPSGSDWTIAGHSGAGRAIAMILGKKPNNVKAALMLDAAYNCTQTGYAWRWRAAKDGRAKVYNVYTPGAGTAQNSSWLVGELGTKIDSRRSSTDLHCSVPRTEFGPLLHEALAETSRASTSEVAPTPQERPGPKPKTSTDGLIFNTEDNPFFFPKGTN